MATTMLPFKHYFQEARRNPHLNPKVSINQRVKDHLDSARVLQGAGIPNSFVSFTQIEKLGINPQSRYNTPLGIYAYQSVYVMENAGLDRPMSTLPFVGTAPFANLFRARGKIVNLSRMRQSEADDYKEKMIGIFLKYAGISGGGEEEKEIREMLEEKVFAPSRRMALVRSPGGYFWSDTMVMSEFLGKSNLTWQEWGLSRNASRRPVLWNKLFRELGIGGCIDEGDRIIHHNEPTQSVFFTKRAIASYERHDNKWSPDSIKTGVAKGNLKMFSDLVIRGNYNPREVEAKLRNSMEELIRGGLFEREGMDFLENVRFLSQSLQDALLESSTEYFRSDKNVQYYNYDVISAYINDASIPVVTNVVKKGLEHRTIIRSAMGMVSMFIRNGIINEDTITPEFVNEVFFVNEYMVQVGLRTGGVTDDAFLERIIELLDVPRQLNRNDAENRKKAIGEFADWLHNISKKQYEKLVEKLKESLTREELIKIIITVPEQEW